MRRFADMLLAVCLAFAAGFLAGRHARPHTGPQSEVPAKADTLIVRDTIRVTEPEYVAVEKVRTDTVRLVTVERDTVLAEVPIERKTYCKDSVYRAVVSGYRPSLEEIEVWPKSVTVTKATAPAQEQAPHLSWGVSTGAGLVAPLGGSAGFGIYIGFGMQYRF